MPDPHHRSLINFGDLSKPADTLIKKVSSAVGGLFKPYQIKQIAKAEAEAAIIKAEAEIEITELQRRALFRFIEEESKRQRNMEEITEKAIPQLTDSAKPDQVEDDWIANFFDKCRIVSDTEMQALWSRILSGEANAPGTYSKRTVNFVSALDKIEAHLFTNLCGFTAVMGSLQPLVFDPRAEIYIKNGLNFTTLNNLQSIGLITFQPLMGYQRQKLPKKVQVYYYGQMLGLSIPDHPNNNLPVGTVFLTNIGQELAPICAGKPVEGFWEVMLREWNSFKPVPIEPSATSPNPSENL